MFELPDTLMASNVKEVQQDILDYLQQQKKELVIDASSLEDIDAAGIQLLLSARISCQQRDLDYQLVGEDQLLKKLLEISGGQDILDE